MNLFESNNGETRQQRLALTWSGKNESVNADDTEATTPEEALQEETPVTPEPQPTDTRPRLTLTKSGPAPVVQTPVEDIDEGRIEQEEVVAEEPVESLPIPDAVDEPATVVPTPVEATALNDHEAELAEEWEEEEPQPETLLYQDEDASEEELQPEALLSDDDVAESEPEPARPTLTLTRPPAAAVGPTTAEEPSGGLENVVSIASEATTEVMEPVATMDEGATYAIPPANPVELSDEFKTHDHEPISQKDSFEMEEPKKVMLTKAAVIPEPDEDAPVLAKPVMAATIPASTSDEDKTCTLRPRRLLKKENTCKLKPDTSEIIAESLGGKLRAARELAGMSEFELAEKTRISSEYITSLENEAFADLPLAPIYVKSYLKTLARQFGLNADELIVLYEEKTGELKAKAPAKKDPEPKKASSDAKDATASKWLNRSIAAVAAAVVILMIAGVLLKTLGGSQLTPADLQVITNDDLCDSIRTTYLPSRHLPIPGHETAAMNE